MFVLILLAGSLVIIYFLAVRIVMLYSQCTEEEAKKKLASWWRENVSGQPQDTYELSSDNNYRRDVNSAVEGIVGEARYNDLCELDKWSSTLAFDDRHSGYSTVNVTVNSSDKNEEKRLQRILESVTRRYVLNYGDPANAKVLSVWSRNKFLRLPMLIIMYSRNEKEKKMLDAIERAYINKIARKCVVRRGKF